MFVLKFFYKFLYNIKTLKNLFLKISFYFGKFKWVRFKVTEITVPCELVKTLNDFTFLERNLRGIKGLKKGSELIRTSVTEPS